MKWYEGKILEKEMNWRVHKVENNLKSMRRVISDKL